MHKGHNTLCRILGKHNPAINFMFKTSLTNTDKFTITYELVPGQGAGGKQVDRLLDFARQAKADGRIKALSITDNPGGNPTLAPVAIGTELLQMGMEPLIHFSLKDKNRNQVESHIFLYQRLKVRSLLVMGGDFPKPGYYGQGKPVFDLDTIQTLQLMQDMETGCYRNHTGKDHTDQPTLFKGCVVSPFKATEAEQIWQYAKLLHKVRAGADFIITQLGFDMRKFGELIEFLRQEHVQLPVLANIFIPSLPVAKVMAAGKVPGVLLSRELVAQMEQEHAARDSKARLYRAAAMIVQVKNFGYQGVHIGGNGLGFADVRFVMDRAEEMDRGVNMPTGDFNFPNTTSWYYYKVPCSSTGKPVMTHLTPGSKPGGTAGHALTHHLLFSTKTVTGRSFAKFCRFCAKGTFRSKFLYTVERIIKGLLFNCRMCGDCTLMQSTYLCPQSGCPKRLVNGPCGGSSNGRCEVFPERRCFWVRVYERLDAQSSVRSLTDCPHLPPKDWALDNTSSWINYFQKQEKP